MELVELSKWINGKLNTPLIIAGPCSAESEEQVMKTAMELTAIEEVSVFRAGIWKPRTRPGTFEGAGKKGLKWLKKVKQETRLLVITEVANPQHVEDVLKEGIDMIWIGARTTANPFSMQEIADALAGVDIPVFVKNPINPDMELWIGAIERLHKAGIRRLAAIHRGFYPFEQTLYRNIPRWEMPIELKRRFENLPVICDPSHMAGTTEYIKSLSQKAMDLNMNGLMIESHFNPAVALSDAAQQLTPEKLAELLKGLKIRTPQFPEGTYSDLLTQFRDQIDSIDNQLIELLAKRMEIVREIGAYKKDQNITILQLRRWKEIFDTRIAHSSEKNISRDFMVKLLQLIHDESIREQM